MILNIIWDVDGTLFDTYPAIADAYVEVARAHGGAVDTREAGELARVGLGHCAGVLASRLGVPASVVSAEFEERYARGPLEAQGPFPGVVEVCRAVQAAGGLNTIFTHRGAVSTRALLQAHGMIDLFEIRVSVEDGYPKKPDPSGFRAVLERAKRSRETTIAIGDRMIDIAAGKAAGLYTVLYGSGPSVPEPDLRVSDYTGLLAQLRRAGRWSLP